MDIVIGVDIGQRSDPTAVAVVEAVARDGRTHFLVRHLERLPLGTPYPAVTARLRRIVERATEQAGALPKVFTDATGVGQPVTDLLRAANLYITPVYFTHGDRRTIEAGEVRLGKAWLVSRLQVLLQDGRLHLPRTAEAEALAKELLDYEIRVDQDGNDRYGAFRVGTHDDLVTALGLATQEDAGGMSAIVVEHRPTRLWAATAPVAPWERD